MAGRAMRALPSCGRAAGVKGLRELSNMDKCSPNASPVDGWQADMALWLRRLKLPALWNELRCLAVAR